MSGQRAQPWQRRLLASLEQPLEPETDAEQRHAVSDRRLYLATPRVVEESSRAKVTDARHDDAANVREL